MKKSKIDLVLEYFRNFADKNLNALDNMFADDVKLTDWNIKASGKQQVLRENKAIFDNIGTINVLVNTMAQDKDVVFSEIQVVLDEDTTIKVVDIIFFDMHNKIIEIKAYKQ
jgi:ketosteroid isomerase-like protein